MKTTQKTKIQSVCMIGVVSAAICILAPLAIPMPSGVPITLQTLIISLAAILLGAKHGSMACLLYLLIGAVGLPVFSNFTGGYQCFVGPTGGFLLSFPLMAYIIGLGSESRRRPKVALLISLILGNLMNLFFGTLLYCLTTHTSVMAGIIAVVLPFLPATIIKLILSWILGNKLKKRLVTLL